MEKRRISCFVANEIPPEILQNSGGKAYKLANNSPEPSLAETKTYKELIDLLNSHFKTHRVR